MRAHIARYYREVAMKGRRANEEDKKYVAENPLGVEGLKLAVTRSMKNAVRIGKPAMAKRYASIDFNDETWPARLMVYAERDQWELVGMFRCPSDLTRLILYQDLLVITYEIDRMLPMDSPLWKVYDEMADWERRIKIVKDAADADLPAKD